MKDAEANAEEDQKFEELVTTRNQADAMIHATRKTVEESKDITDEEKAAIDTAVEELEAALKDDDKEAIEAKLLVLTEASSDVAQRAYAAQAAEAGGEAPTGDAGSADPDAVDAEFEEVKEDK